MFSDIWQHYQVIKDHAKVLKVSKVTDVESGPSGPLQFSTSVEVRPGNVGLLVRP